MRESVIGEHHDTRYFATVSSIAMCMHNNVPLTRIWGRISNYCNMLHPWKAVCL